MLSRWFCTATLCCIAFGAQADLPLTPFEQSTTYQLPDSKTVSAYLHTLQAQMPQTSSILSVGESAGGRPLEVMLMSKDAEFLKDGKPAADKPTIMLIGSQHGNEPSGTEAVQILARQVLGGDMGYLLDKVNIVALVLANPDGRDLHQRLNAKNENPNVDFIVTAADETKSYINLLNRFQPDVVYDLHSTGRIKNPLTSKEGYMSTVNAQFEVGDNPNIEPALNEYANAVFLPAFLKKVNAAGIKADRYDGEIITMNQVVTRGAMNVSTFRNYASMTGALTILAESLLDDDPSQKYATPGNIKVRVQNQYIALKQLMDLVAKDSVRLQKITRAAHDAWQQSATTQVALQYGFYLNKKTPKIVETMYDIKHKKNIHKVFPLHDRIMVTKTDVLPAAYVITADQDRFRQLLDNHHITYQVVSEPQTIQVEQQRVSKLGISPVQQPGVRNWLDVTLDTKPVALAVKPGDLIVSTKQPMGVFTAVMLDPRSYNSVYEDMTWRGLLMQDPLPVAVAKHL